MEHKRLRKEFKDFKDSYANYEKSIDDLVDGLKERMQFIATEKGQGVGDTLVIFHQWLSDLFFLSEVYAQSEKINGIVTIFQSSMHLISKVLPDLKEQVKQKAPNHDCGKPDHDCQETVQNALDKIDVLIDMLETIQEKNALIKEREERRLKEEETLKKDLRSL